MFMLCNIKIVLVTYQPNRFVFETGFHYIGQAGLEFTN